MLHSGSFRIYQSNQLRGDGCEESRDFSMQRERGLQLDVRCPENLREEKTFKGIHNTDMQRFSLKILPQSLPSHRTTESQLHPH